MLDGLSFDGSVQLRSVGADHTGCGRRLAVVLWLEEIAWIKQGWWAGWCCFVYMSPF